MEGHFWGFSRNEKELLLETTTQRPADSWEALNEGEMERRKEKQPFGAPNVGSWLSLELQ